METKNINNMDTQLKNALELIKSKLSKEEQVKALFSNDKGDVVLNDLNFKGLNVYLKRLKARQINNSEQEAWSYIINKKQKAENIYNEEQEAFYYINNEGQESRDINNYNQKKIV